MLSKCFTFRYMTQDAKVYLVKKSPVEPRTDNGVFHSHILSEPFSGSSHEVRNAIVAYICPSICELKCQMCASDDASTVEAIEMNLIDVQGFCDSLGMPLLVTLMECCELETRQERAEVMFYEGKIRNDDANQAWLRKLNKK